MPTRPSRLAALVLALPLLTGVALAEVPAAPGKGQVFSEQVEVNVVNLEVFTTDRNGKPVTDLTREDFEVLEDGRPVVLTNFYAAEKEVRSGAAAPAPRGASTPTASSAPPGRPEGQRLHLIVFVDDVNTVPEHRNRMLAQLGDFFDRTLEPGDVVMLVRYDGVPRIVRPFTGDRGQLKGDLAALAKLSGDIGKRQASYQSAVEYLREAIEGAGGADNPAVQGAVETYADSEAHLLLGTLTALDQTVGALAGVPGRKAVVYLADGIPTVPGEDLFTALTSRPDFVAKPGSTSYLGSRGYDPAARYRDVTAHAARNHVSFYPLSPAGTPGGASRVGNDRSANYQNSLKFLAEETGGRAILNVGGDARADFARLTEDFSQYYSLGYTPPRHGDGVQHRVEVKVKRRGVALRYWQWYKDKPLVEVVADRTAAAMLFGLEDNPLGATLSVGIQTEMVNGGFFQVPVKVSIPIAKLTLLLDGDSRVGHVRLFVVASGNGETTPVKTSETEIRIPEAKFAAGAMPDYVHEVRITLKPGEYALGVGIRDDLAAATSYIKGTVKAGR
ncbi:MAG TPA: VWA domain-containing protein [Thermoanaerobaculia bacterium]|jgi:VWFA-related protein|nr:VWA domain-containing protein [Thermoanaerobaculia bacterium]